MCNFCFCIVNSFDIWCVQKFALNVFLFSQTGRILLPFKKVIRRGTLLEEVSRLLEDQIVANACVSVHFLSR